jgi:DNA-binding transcriptional ArsR family regulator
MALTDDITDPRIAKALAHPLRLEILRRLGDRTASPSEIAAEIGAPLTNVSYHVRKLRSLGLIKLVRKTPKRGVVEHYYSAKPRQTVSDDAWAGTPSTVKEALLAPVAEKISARMAAAVVRGGFERKDAHLTNEMTNIDNEAFVAIAKLLERTYGDIAAIVDAARARLKADTQLEPLDVTVAMMLFENRADEGARA